MFLVFLSAASDESWSDDSLSDELDLVAFVSSLWGFLGDHGYQQSNLRLSVFETQYEKPSPNSGGCVV